MTILAPASAAISAQDVRKTYGHGEAAVRALDGLTVAFHRGEFAAVMGPSGSGKSTLLHCLAGLDDADAGSIVVDGVELTGLRERQRTLLRRDRLGFVFQAFNLVPSLTAGENIVLPLTLAGRRPDPAWLGTLVATLGLGDRLGHRPAELSGGQQQRAAVARALVTRPAIVFADEPTGNLDSRAGTRLLELLRQLSGDLGQTVVMVTHDPVAAGYADRVVFLADGRTAGDLDDPTPSTVLARMADLGADRS